MAAVRFESPALPGLEVARLDLADPRWKAHVENRTDSLPFHHPAWTSFLAECYDLDGYVLAPMRNDRPTGGIPLLRARRPFGPRRLVGLPFTDYLPFLDDGATDAAQLLIQEQAHGAARIQIRAPVPGLPATTVGCRHVLTLGGDPEETYARFSAKRVRQLLRRIERERSVSVRRGESMADMAQFYALHAAARRRLGVPVQPKRFFRLLWDRVLEPGHGWLLLAEADGRTVGGTVLLTGGDTVVYKFSAADRAAKHVFPAHALLWDAIREGSLRGFTTFDFGRTDAWNTGLRQFNAAWGADELPLAYAHAHAHAEDAGDEEQADGPGAASRTLGVVIRRSPVWVARGIGETLYRYTA